VDVKRGIARRQANPARQLGSIRAAVPRTRLTIVPSRGRNLGELSSWFSSIIQAASGAVKGFAAGGPAGAVAGGIGGAASGIGKTGKGAAQAQDAAVQQQQLGPLAGVSTGTIVAGVMGFSALIIVLARSGGK
jgi:hypothetical protein